MFAENTIDEARTLQLTRFTATMEEILDDLISSLSCVTSLFHALTEFFFFSVTLSLNRASPDELNKTQRQTEETLSDLRRTLGQWTLRIEEVRTQQQSKLNEVLLK